MRQDWYYEPDGPPPGGAGAWQPLPQRSRWCRPLNDWYNCQAVSAQIMATPGMLPGQLRQPGLPVLRYKLPLVPLVPRAQRGMPLVSRAFLPLSFLPAMRERSIGEWLRQRSIREWLRQRSKGSGSGTSGSGSGESGCDITLVNYQLVQGDGTLTVADAIGEIGPLCPWAIDGGDGEWYVPAGTYLKVLPILKSGTRQRVGVQRLRRPDLCRRRTVRQWLPMRYLPQLPLGFLPLLQVLSVRRFLPVVPVLPVRRFLPFVSVRQWRVGQRLFGTERHPRLSERRKYLRADL